MSLIEWIMLGLTAGFIASKIINENETGRGLLLDLILGIVGAVAGGVIFSVRGRARSPVSISTV